MCTKVKTPDGVADAYFVHPRSGKHPGILMWLDFFSVRPAYQQMADKLAASGYAVLALNHYYRHAKAPLVDKADAGNSELMDRIRTFIKALTLDAISRDARAGLTFLDQQPAVDTRRKLGTFGYCMGGEHAFITAAGSPERVGAVASFHCSLAHKDPASPHLLIPKMKAHALVAIAANDDTRNPQEKTVLRQAFAQRKLPAEIEVYEGTLHGWCTPDMAKYHHAAQAKRAWGRLLALLERALK